jgi:transcriptional regulator with XRE-family HTH domain
MSTDRHSTSDAVAQNVRASRRRHGWTIADLAQRCSDTGSPGLTENVLENIEYGRRRVDGERTRDITVDELAGLAHALAEPPSRLWLALAPDFEMVRRLAEQTAAEVLTGCHGLNACAEDCMWAGPGNQVAGGVHRHPFAAVMDEQED